MKQKRTTRRKRVFIASSGCGKLGSDRKQFRKNDTLSFAMKRSIQQRVAAWIGNYPDMTPFITVKIIQRHHSFPNDGHVYIVKDAYTHAIGILGIYFGNGRQVTAHVNAMFQAPTFKATFAYAVSADSINFAQKCTPLTASKKRRITAAFRSHSQNVK